VGEEADTKRVDRQDNPEDKQGSLFADNHMAHNSPDMDNPVVVVVVGYIHWMRAGMLVGRYMKQVHYCIAEHMAYMLDTAGWARMEHTEGIVN
jgi:hypothetical protein